MGKFVSRQALLNRTTECISLYVKHIDANRS